MYYTKIEEMIDNSKREQRFKIQMINKSFTKSLSFFMCWWQDWFVVTENVTIDYLIWKIQQLQLKCVNIIRNNAKFHISLRYNDQPVCFLTKTVKDYRISDGDCVDVFLCPLAPDGTVLPTAISNCN